MTPEELLKPRYKVIADYPKSDFHVGDIIEFAEKSDFFTGSMEWMSKSIINPKGGSGMYCIKLFEPYPHLFRKLEWWEDRDIKDMPQYVKWRSAISDVTYVVKLIDIQGEKFVGQLKDGHKMGAEFTPNQDYPATEQEFLNQTATCNNKHSTSQANS